MEAVIRQYVIRENVDRGREIWCQLSVLRLLQFDLVKFREIVPGTPLKPTKDCIRSRRFVGQSL
jgi:hypothetical protein